MALRYKLGIALAVFLALAVVSMAAVLRYEAPCPEVTAGERSAGGMQAVHYYCYGAPDVLALELTDLPDLEEHDVLVRVRAAGVNPLDWHYMRGSPYFMRFESGLAAPADRRMGVDFSGTVTAVGTAVTRFKPGDEVFGGRSGAFAEYLVIPEDRSLALKPTNISHTQAAAVPIAAITALQALRDKGVVRRGQTVLINGASGGVGTFAVQIAKAMGAEVTGVCSTRNLGMVRSLGADHVVDYTRDNFIDADQRYDVIIDNVGNHSPLAYSRVLTEEGRLVMVGGAAGDWLGPLSNPIKALLLSPFVAQEFILLMAQIRQADLEVLAQMMTEGQLKPVIDRQYALLDDKDAIRYSESGRARGKIVLNVSGGSRH